jgi:hypothetical protein
MCGITARHPCPPNLPLQLTPLRVDKIGPILSDRIVENATRSIGTAQLNGNPLGERAIECLPFKKQ